MIMSGASYMRDIPAGMGEVRAGEGAGCDVA